MSEDRDIRRAIESGKKNRRTTELIHNWCRHANVKKCGGTGLIEAQTGLPIGHHAMACDHAPASGMATWDLADAALDFHDRNCIDCKHRFPVRLPNLSELLGERERAQAEQKQIRDLEESQRVAALASRQETRRALTEMLPATSQTIIEQLGELDDGRHEDQRTKLIETAKLAPEIFTPEIIEHYFQMLEAPESWFSAVGLETLFLLNADPVRLARCALTAIRDFNATNMASKIVLEHIAHVDPSLIAGAFRSLSLLAAPPDSHFTGTVRTTTPEPLLALYHHYPDAVKAAIEVYLDSKNYSAIENAARAILVIEQQDKSIAAPFARTIIAKLARPELLIDLNELHSHHDEHHLFHDLQEVIKSSLKAAPQETDELVSSFLTTADSKTTLRLLSAYESLFHSDGWREDIEEIEAHSIALRRLVNTATSMVKFDDLWELLGMFRSGAQKGLEGLIRKEASYLLGAAILLERQRLELANEQRQAKEFLAYMGINNQFNFLVKMQEGLVGWVAGAAADSPETVKIYLETLSGIPEDSPHLRGIMITALSRPMGTVEGLNLALPALYSALVGSSQQERAAAIRALKEIDSARRNDLPRLLFEIFLTTLCDPYRIVHQSAVHTLERFSLPEEFRPVLKLLVRNLVFAYSHGEDGDEFLAECISLYVSQYADKEELVGDMGALLVSQLARMKPEIFMRSHFEWNAKKLKFSPGIGALVVKLLRETSSDYETEPIFRVLRGLPPATVHAERKSLEGVAMDRLDNVDSIGSLIELLTRSGALTEAERIAKAVVNSIPDTTRDHQRRQFASLLHTATKLEATVAGVQQDETVEQLIQQWRQTIDDIEQDRKEYETRRDLLRGLLGKNQGN
ncbi:MAG TPA: hypothetical protein VIU93_02405 [Gallionellaceae bacterium]